MALEWDEHKETIISLYSYYTLDEVVKIMAEEYNFHADRRSYCKRFEKWSVGKRHNSGRMNVLDNVAPVPAGHVGRASQQGESSASGALLEYAGTETAQVDGSLYHGDWDTYAESEAGRQGQSQNQAMDGFYVDLHGHPPASTTQGQYYPAVDAQHHYIPLPSPPMGAHDGAQAPQNVNVVPQPTAQPFAQNVSANPLPPPQNRVLGSNGKTRTRRASRWES